MEVERIAGPERTAPEQATVVDRLDRVDDPELDRSIVELGYVESLWIDGAEVAVEFVLPTAWCSPAFAWMMAAGIRDEVGALPSVDTVRVDLRDHVHGAEINAGVNGGLDFEEAFDGADGGIEAVRRKLDAKARFARQHAAVDALQSAGLDAEQVATLTLEAVDLDYADGLAAVALLEEAIRVTVPREPLADYLEKARATGLVTADGDRLFADRDEEPIDPAELERVRREARLAASNIAGQGAICSALHEARNGVPADD